ncbi:putative ABC transporter [Nemania abortiva]|nr:putative ABC transporter [Nemania abortiva]
MASGSEIVATSQQTRFNIVQDRRSSEISIDQITLSIGPSDRHGAKPNKSKARDLLVDSTLKLKGGTHYGLLGSNGCGKSTLMKAIATKAIPGLSLATRIALLQQTAANDEDGEAVHEGLDKSALDYILDNDAARNEIQSELDALSEGNFPGGEEKLIRAYRHLQHNQMQRQLAQLQRNANLRSGARGSKARKEMTSYEKDVDGARARLAEEDLNLESQECQDELMRASQLMADLQLQLDERPQGDLKARASKMLSWLGFSDAMIGKPLGELSGGWQMRCKLANILLQDADIILLDEPTNFLDLLGIIWLQKYLIDLRSESTQIIVIVSHDRDFIDNVCQEIILVRDKTLVYFGGNLTAYEEDFRAKRQNLIKMKEAQEKQVAHMEKTIANNIKVGKKQGDDNKLRQAVSRQKRLEDRMGMQVNAKGGKFKLSRDMAGFHVSKRAAIEIPPEESAVSMSLPQASDLRFPGALVSLDHVTFSYSVRDPPVLRDVSLTVHMDSRIGIVGLNGSGKSTLVKLLTDAIQPTKGAVSRHPRVRIGYYSQLVVEDLRASGMKNPDETALSTLAAAAGDAMDESDMRGLLASFHLVGQQASHVPLAKLSGGQLVRVALACIVWDHPHLLVLDEVTTHLDFYTVQALSRALREFDGAMVIVSHDRFFMKSVIEGIDNLPGGDSIDNEEEEGSVELQRSLHVLKKGKLSILEHGIQEFEESLEARVDKLLAM